MICDSVRQDDGTGRIAALLDRGETDPRRFHDALRTVMSDLEADRRAVPVTIRRALDDLEADIAEAYFNNVPV